MFNQLFFRSGALARQVSAPFVYERSRYLPGLPPFHKCLFITGFFT